MKLKWSWLGRVAYRDAAALQEALRRRLLDGDADAEQLLLLEHEPVVTLGRSAGAHDILDPAALAARGISVERSTRGGQLTYHGPGQLVAYAVVRLDRGIVAHVEALCQAAVELAGELGVAARFRRDCPGVWVGDRKLGSVGLHVHRRVTIHGLALNVSTALEPFQLIVACGLSATQPTSLALESGKNPTPSDLAPRFAAALARSLRREPLLSAPPSLE